MKLSHLDTCLPDYFNGYHEPVLAVPVHNKMDREELKAALLNDINSTWEHLNHEDAWPDGVDYEKLIDELIITKPGEPVFPNLEDEPEDESEFVDSVYVYICLDKEGE